MLLKVIVMLAGIVLMIVGYKFKLPFLMVVGGVLIAAILLMFISMFEGAGKSEEEKELIYRKNMNQFHKNMSMGLDYTATKMAMNDAINKDIQKDIEKATRSRRY